MRSVLAASHALFAALLHLYPRRFRLAYGEQMRLTFRDACHAAYRRNGATGVWALWLPTLLDLVKSVLEERAQQGELTMSKARLMALAGPLTVLVGVVWLAAALGDLLARIGLGGDEAFWDLFVALWSLPFFLSFIPLLFALIGTQLRFSQSAGALGRIGLGLSVAGCAGLIVAVLVQLLAGAAAATGQPTWINYAAAVGFLIIRLGLLLFGVSAWQRRLLPRWNFAPLLLGATVVLSLPFEWFGVPPLVPVPWITPMLHFALSGAAWVLLGLALRGTERASRQWSVASG
jgi:hypothetical protein